MRNKFEERIYRELSKKVSGAGSSPAESAGSVKYEVDKIPYMWYGTYLPDFKVKTTLGKEFYVETKGHFRPEDKRKLVAVKKQHPDLDIRIVFYSSNKKNSRWAIKHGFPYAIGSVPEEWLNETL